TMPKEEIQLRGKRIEPFAAKIRDFTYLRKTLVKERIIWVPANGTLEVQLDGKPAPLTFEWPKPQPFSIRPGAVKARRGAKTRKAMKVKRRRSRARIITATDSDRFISLLARSKPFHKIFANAWVLMDRDVNANDNAEHLFRYLRKRRRDINSWFVVEKGSPDWNRLRAEGFKRLIPYGSILWKVLCLNARFIVSSHADAYVYSPFVLTTGEKPQWRFVFLQHGVI